MTWNLSQVADDVFWGNGKMSLKVAHLNIENQCDMNFEWNQNEIMGHIHTSFLHPKFA